MASFLILYTCIIASKYAEIVPVSNDLPFKRFVET